MNQDHPKVIASLSEVVELLRCIDQRVKASDGVTAWLIHNFLIGPDGIISKPVFFPVQAPASRRTVLLTSEEFTRMLDDALRADDSLPWLNLKNGYSIMRSTKTARFICNWNNVCPEGGI
jgi:hypothetical protein